MKHNRLYFDGGMGTLLQAAGLPVGTPSGEWNLSHPEVITAIHKNYLEAGADILMTNTVGLNCFHFNDPEPYVWGAMECAKRAVQEHGRGYIAYDIGPTGTLLAPNGTLSFEDAVAVFAQSARFAQQFGADAIIIETMNDAYETKAAVLAAKEYSTLPIFVTNVFDETGKLMTGANARAMITMLEGLGVDAIGMNCSLGPEKMLPIVREYAKYASLPIIVNPNAGIPCVKDGNTVFDVDADVFSDIMVDIAKAGATILGGCCGTTPEYIRKMVEKTSSLPYSLPQKKKATVVSSYTHALEFGTIPVLIGERINPTGKKAVKDALREKNDAFILTEGIRQADAGVVMLDVNAGLPEINEAESLARLVTGLQGVTDLPLQIDTANPEALKNALRVYNGKALINSVTGNQDSMNAVFPLVKKYGGVVIALTMDENGIPETAQGRLAIAEKIVSVAGKYGIGKQDIIVDPLTLTISADNKNAAVTLEAIRLIKEKLGVFVSLGVSNISFGLPDRDAINSTFFALALDRGLDAAIMNPFSPSMMKAYYAFCALSGMDRNCEAFISYATNNLEIKKDAPQESMTLSQAILKGLVTLAGEKATLLLQTDAPLSIINEHIIPALNKIGSAFEQKKAYLPQLLMSAEAASAAFGIIKEALPPSQETGKRIVLATVKGDIHDIGKNIVKVLLENFGFTVLDLGRDVSPEQVVQALDGCHLVGLSALMTTTVPAMEETIRLIRKISPDTKVMVGGAVLTKEYADQIGADYFAADAMGAVRIAQTVFEK